MKDTYPDSKLRRLLKSQFALSDLQIARIIARAPSAYKSYNIKKKNGGHRRISQPARETKAIQYWLIEKVFSHFEEHPCATAYKHHSSIKTNAIAHSKASYFLKLDFEDFFPSITSTDIVKFLSKSKIKLNNDDLKDLARLVCIKGKNGLNLSIGAPSSPKISNILLYNFDSTIHEWCTSNDVTYTRYADDITFSSSTAEMTPIIEKKLIEVLNDLEYPKLKLNPTKRHSLSKKDRVTITGINITSENNLSTGRERKRHIRSKVYQHLEKGLKESEKLKLRGLISFVEFIEPGFKLKLRKKYGPNSDLGI